MDTPICDFVREYGQKNTLRLHMPGHKGVSFLGMEQLDLTEIRGADSLYEAEGIIAQSEANVSTLFGCRTFYSTEGSSQCIRAMLYLVSICAQGRRPLIAAGRNAHKTFLTAAALLDADVVWLNPDADSGYLSCDISAPLLDRFLQDTERKPDAVYLTSPDYLGNILDIGKLAQVCHAHDVLLVVDNAHGAYLKFLPESMHPMDLGADICCDSAHKTLPVLTGGAYLHLSESMDERLGGQVKNAMMLFGSTSPSYLILQSLDAANGYLETYPMHLEAFLPHVAQLKKRLTAHGYSLYGQEPLKLTIAAKSFGYTGTQLADQLRQENMEPEFADRDYLVIMLTPELEAEGLNRLEQALCRIPRKEALKEAAPLFIPARRILSIREAMMSPSEIMPIEQCTGRILAVPTVGCPPAVPILVCGEQIDEHAVKMLKYYGIDSCCVVKQK